MTHDFSVTLGMAHKLRFTNYLVLELFVSRVKCVGCILRGLRNCVSIDQSRQRMLWTEERRGRDASALPLQCPWPMTGSNKTLSKHSSPSIFSQHDSS